MAKIKVSQSTINQIKKMGMDKALKSAAKNPIVGGSSTSSADKAQMEFVEGVRRMYGEKRLTSSLKPAAKAAPAAKTPRQTVANVRQAERSTVKKAAVKKAAATNPRQADYKTPVKSTPKKETPKKQSTTSNPVTATFNKISPYGNKNQKFENPFDGIQRKIGANSPADAAKAKSKKPETKQDKYAAVAATNAKRMGISVAEYNRRLAAATKKK